RRVMSDRQVTFGLDELPLRDNFYEPVDYNGLLVASAVVCPVTGAPFPAALSVISLDGGSRWRVVLDGSRRWSTGEPLRADDMVRAVRRALTRRAGVAVTYLDPDEPVREIDEQTVDLRLIRPVAHLPTALSTPQLAPRPRDPTATL